MEHLIEPRIVAHLWDGVPLTEDERTHLAQCEACQTEVAALTLLQTEFDVARVSQLSSALETRLLAILPQVQRDAPRQSSLAKAGATIWGELVNWVDALLLWDSRQQAGALGVRNAARTGYRLLFGAGDSEVELMVEPHNGLLRVMGEVMGTEHMGDGEAGDGNGDGNSDGLALVELLAQQELGGAEGAYEVESDGYGRFTLAHVPPGTYRMTVTPRNRAMIVIEPLELT